MRSACAALAPAERRVLDQREVKVVERRTAEGVAAKGWAEAALIRAGSIGEMNWDIEEGCSIIRTLAEVVFAHFAGCGEFWLRNLVGTIDTVFDP